MAFDYEPCGAPGRNKIDHCVDRKGHEGPHDFANAPYPEKVLSEELQEVKELLISTCPDYMVDDFKNGNVLSRCHCCYHKAADAVRRAQFTVWLLGR